MQELWIEKARALKIPLSSKSHAVGQRGSYTGVGIDTFSGRFSMLPDKLNASAVAPRAKVRARVGLTRADSDGEVEGSRPGRARPRDVTVSYLG